MPMAGIVERMAVAKDVKDALLSRSGPYAGVLALVEAQERGDWDAVVDAAAAVGVDEFEVSASYAESLAWASERVGGMA
jgi:EAL and modified HD-GYP domain-containing signal transduction protein